MRLRAKLAALLAIGLASTAALPANAAPLPKNGYLVIQQSFTDMVTQTPGAGSYVYLARGERPKYSPDGRRIAFFRSDGTESIIVRTLANGVEAQIAEMPQILGQRTLAWSPDGTALVMAQENELRLVVVATGAQSVIWSSANVTVREPAWAPDGSRIAFDATTSGVAGSAIMTVKPDGTGLRTVFPADGVNNDYPDWSPDSKKIAFVTYKYDPVRGEIVTLNRSGSGQPFRVSHLSHPLAHTFTGVAWSPNGKQIAGLQSYPDYLPGEGPFDERRVVRGYQADGSGSAPLTGPIQEDGTGNPSGLDWAPKIS
jgi:Tol biopolymer transport system component